MDRDRIEDEGTETYESDDGIATVSIGSVIQEWTPDEGEPSDLMAYIQVAATLDGKKDITLGTMIGVPEWQHGTCRAAGGGVRPFLSTWWADASDWQDVSSDQRAAAAEALSKAASSLWRQVQALRSRAEAEEYVRECSEDEGPESYEEAAEVFAALYGREPEPEDGDQGQVWSLCCAAVRS